MSNAGPINNPSPNTGPVNIDVTLTKENLLEVKHKQLDLFLSSMPDSIKSSIFKEMSLPQLLLLTSKQQYSKKFNDLETVNDDLKKMADALSFLNLESNKAREANDKGTTHRWSKEAQDLVTWLAAENGQSIRINRDPAVALEQLNGAAKDVTEQSKRKSTEANELRTDMNTFIETMSGILKNVNKAIETSARNST